MDMHYGTIKSREIDNQINGNPCCNLTSDQRTFAEWLFAHDVRDSLGARRFQKHSAVQKNGARFETALYFEVLRIRTKFLQGPPILIDSFISRNSARWHTLDTATAKVFESRFKNNPQVRLSVTGAFNLFRHRIPLRSPSKCSDNCRRAGGGGKT